MIKKLAVAWTIIWTLWKNRKKIHDVISEAIEFSDALKEALEDKKISKAELELLLQEAGDINNAIIVLLGGI